MKVILTKDVKGLGRIHDSVTTTDGYALNYLIPKKMAIAATSGAVKEAELRVKQLGDRAVLDSTLLAQNISTLGESKLVIKMKANEKGHLYDAVGEPEILRAAKEQTNIDLPDGVIKLEKPIKEVGTHDVPVASGEVLGKFTVTIEAE